MSRAKDRPLLADLAAKRPIKVDLGGGVVVHVEAGDDGRVRMRVEDAGRDVLDVTHDAHLAHAVEAGVFAAAHAHAARGRP